MTVLPAAVPIRPSSERRVIGAIRNSVIERAALTGERLISPTRCNEWLGN
jgi:hypothetical protein